MEINENITGSITETELKIAILEYINKSFKKNFTNIKNIKLINGSHEEIPCFTDIAFTLENQTENKNQIFRNSGGVLA